MRRILGLLLMLSVVAGLTTACHSGASYFFSTAGSDDNPCTEALPCETLSKRGGRLASITLGPGDEVLLKRGDTWTGDFVQINQSGTTSGGRILVRTYGTDTQRPTLKDAADAAGNTHNTCVDVVGDWVSVRGLNIEACGVDAGDDDLFFTGIDVNGDRAEVYDVVVQGQHIGVDITDGADYASILYSRLVDNNLWKKTPPVDCANQAQGINILGDHATVLGNTIKGSVQTACDGVPHGAAIELFGASFTEVLRNTVSSSESFSELGVDGTLDANDNTYAYNVIFNDDDLHSVRSMRGLITRGSGHPAGPVLRTRFYNNSIRFRTTGSGNYNFEGIVCSGDCEDAGADNASILDARNNVVSIDAPDCAAPDSCTVGDDHQRRAMYAEGSSMTSDYNLFHCPNESLSSCLGGGFSLGGNDRTGVESGGGTYVPGWIDPDHATAPDLHLASGSSNCNSGTTGVYGRDRDNETVPQHSVTDRGAYEDC